MRSTIRFVLLLIGMKISGAMTLAQNELSQPHPGFLQQYAATNRFTLGLPAAIHVTSTGDAVLFLRSGPRSFVRDLYEFDVATGREKLLASAGKLLGGD